MGKSLESMLGEAGQVAKASKATGLRVLKIAGGFACLILGIVMLVTPGPGWLVIAVGLGLLGTEFAWARTLLGYLKSGAARLRRALTSRSGGKDSQRQERRSAIGIE